MKADVLYPGVVVYRDAFPKNKELVQALKATDQWEDWYDVGKQLGISHSKRIDFKGFPTLEQWTNQNNRYEPTAKDLEFFYHDIENVFYEVTADYMTKFPVDAPIFRRNGNDILKYESHEDGFITKQASGTEKLALPFHTDFPQALEPGHNILPLLTVTYYLNDDYEGGEIDYRIFHGKYTEMRVENGDQVTAIDPNYTKPIDAFRYKPRAGDVIVFPSNIPYYHGVQKVTKGEKYFIRTYWMYALEEE